MESQVIRNQVKQLHHCRKYSKSLLLVANKIPKTEDILYAKNTQYVILDWLEIEEKRNKKGKMP